MIFIKDFIKLPAAPGILLFIAAVLSLVAANTGLAGAYQAFLSVPVVVQFGEWAIDKPSLLWINDGLMAIFFLLVGLEIKREILQGHLSSREQIMLPAVAAFGGLAIPALIYVLFNHPSETAINGWAIPAATDIAFALGVMTLLGSRVPVALKVTLVAIAIIDDLAAILIIAFFYTSKLSIASLVWAAGAALALFIMNRMKVARITPYMLIGLILWVAVLKSGVHATLAGVVIGLMIPSQDARHPGHSPLIKLEHILHPYVAFLILPVFAFANAGVSFEGLTWDALLHPVTLGIALGLFIGKQLGVMGLTWLGVTFRLFKLPEGASWMQYYGMALLTGIGFTMSLFIGTLAFDTDAYTVAVRLGVLGGSLLSGIAGYAVLVAASKKPALT